ncbi:site-specific DNA-methyltransferase [Stenotrophomonas maltophilia group sp. RNC7]|uniref:DNA-methyltransferase n=1 Tax=Stenotrophomonas maltophilia group sp. RNC7 TaxID=3071467 RepID=UPI0027E202E4|nr:site-specific DNA-methyltransferase [Stenotrophomonas maltophilia group sp. RNC7]MDQ4681404.1 site-specific DNA-methyltransferase [Stenotrophomonas maltophilia group sp. RNC7]
MIHVGDCLEVMRGMAAGSVQTCVTSPPYFGLRDYGVAGQIGLEDTPAEYVARLVAVFREVRRLLRDDGTLWLNLGDSYATDSKWGGSTGGKAAAALHGLGGGGRNKTATGLPDKNLIGIPWRVAFALQEDGWFLRQDIIWAKPNPMPESVTDRCTKAHEYLFLLSKSPRYFFDMEAIKEPAAGINNYPPQGGPVPGAPAQSRLRPAVPRGGFDGKTNALPGREAFRATSEKRHKRSVWNVATTPFKEAHFATFPEQLIEPCILAGSPAGGLVLDPFMGAGTTAVVAERLGRQWLGCELNPEYAAIAEARLRVAQPSLSFGDVA